jgi:long-chain acyl-CoA synthetase
MVVGDQRPFIGALITIDEEYFPSWKSQHGKPADATVADLAMDADLRAEVQTAVDEANKAVSHAEAIKKFTVLANDFTEQSGEITPSLKLKRNVVTKNYSDTIDTLYKK